jgi:hypothetical protein
MFSSNVDAMSFDFARQSLIERFTPDICAKSFNISNFYTKTIDIPLSELRRPREVALPIFPEERPIADEKPPQP